MLKQDDGAARVGDLLHPSYARSDREWFLYQTSMSTADSSVGMEGSASAFHQGSSIRREELYPTLSASASLRDPDTFGREDQDVAQSVRRMQRLSDELDRQREEEDNYVVSGGDDDEEEEEEEAGAHCSLGDYSLGALGGYVGAFLTGGGQGSEADKEPPRSRDDDERGRGGQRRDRRGSGWRRPSKKRRVYVEDDGDDEDPLLLQMCPEPSPLLSSLFCCGTLALCWCI